MEGADGQFLGGEALGDISIIVEFPWLNRIIDIAAQPVGYEKIQCWERGVRWVRMVYGAVLMPMCTSKVRKQVQLRKMPGLRNTLISQ